MALFEGCEIVENIILHLEMAITVEIIPFQMSSQGYAAYYYQQPNIRNVIISLQYQIFFILIITMV